MPRIHFQLQLAELKDKLLAMAALAQQAVESAVDAYLQRDKGLCQYVKQNETAINSAQRELDEMAYELLAKEQPMAIDLRFILAVIKINGDLERIGDQSMGISRRTRDILKTEAGGAAGGLCGHGRVCRAHDSHGDPVPAGGRRAPRRHGARDGRRDRSHESPRPCRPAQADPGEAAVSRSRQ